MKSVTLTLACALLSPLAAFSAAITDVSISRTIFADAQAGGVAVEMVSGSASGLFDERRTDADTNPLRSGSVTSFQRTIFSSTASNLDFSGAMYTRNISDGDLVKTDGRSSADIYFTIDDQFNLMLRYTLAGAGDRGNGSGAFLNDELFRVLPSGETLIGDGPGGRIIGSGRYHFRIGFGVTTETFEFVPEALDSTFSLLDISFIVYPIPEPSTAVLLLSGVLCLRRRTSGVFSYACGIV